MADPTLTLRAERHVPLDIDLGIPADGALSPIDVTFTGPGGERLVVPAFGDAAGRTRVRFAAPAEGGWRYDAAGLASGEVEVGGYGGPVPAYRHGRIRAAASGRTLEHADGTPFFWLGDTWWMGLTTRLGWPDEFRTLLDDRVAKGFSVIQIVAGPLPDFASTPDGIWHEQQRNDGGWPWKPGWEGIDPAYYDAADRRIAALVEAGIVPCIVGMWGFYGTVIGRERALAHWRNLVARYAAFPVTFCAAGEVDYPGAPNPDAGLTRDEQREAQLDLWTEVAAAIRAVDPYRNPVTAHPGLGNGRASLRPGTVLDFNILQTSHWSFTLPTAAQRAEWAGDLGQTRPMRMGFEGTLDITREAVAAEPIIPVVNGEPCYEGIMGGNWQDVQRFLFWSGMTAGLAGWTYGANGIWQMSSRTARFANQVSSWGNITWQEAMHHPGGRQVGMGANLLRTLPWWELRPADASVAEEAGRVASHMAVSDRTILVYLPSFLIDERLQGLRDRPIPLPAGRWAGRFVDPSSGIEQPIGTVEAGSDGTWTPTLPSLEDWVLILEAEA